MRHTTTVNIFAMDLLWCDLRKHLLDQVVYLLLELWTHIVPIELVQLSEVSFINNRAD